MPYKLLLAGLLSLSLTACGMLSPAPEPAPRRIPAELLLDCAIALPDGRSSAALARLAQAHRLSLEACNADKAALRKWNG